MNHGKYVFSQIIEFLSPNDFIRSVSKYKGNYKVRTFTCWHQFLYMVFGQLSNRESLSDLITCLQSQQNKSYHLGMGKGTSKANLAKANERRDYRIYEDFAMTLVAQAQRLAIPFESFELAIKEPVYAIDATSQACLRNKTLNHMKPKKPSWRTLLHCPFVSMFFVSPQPML